MALLNQLGATNPTTLESVGQEEYEQAAERSYNQQALRKISKAVFRMAAAWGLESGFQGVEATEIAATANDVCLSGQASAQTTGNFWLWLAVFFMFAVMLALSVKFFPHVEAE